MDNKRSLLIKVVNSDKNKVEENALYYNEDYNIMHFLAYLHYLKSEKVL